MSHAEALEQCRTSFANRCEYFFLHFSNRLHTDSVLICLHKSHRKRVTDSVSTVTEMISLVLLISLASLTPVEGGVVWI